MKNKTTRFLTISLILIVILCIFIFTFLALYMKQKSTETIHDVGNIYMAGMSEQLSMHFETTVGLRLSQVEALVQTLPPGSADPESLMKELVYGAQARGFECLALYSRDGTFEMLDGRPVTMVDPEPYLHSLNQGESKVTVGIDAAGNKIILLGASCDYPMAGGKECTALVAGLPAEYISTTLSLDEEEDSLVYSHIIRRDGSFVIRSAGAFRESYFDRLFSVFDDAENAEQYISELKAAIAAQEDYSAVLETDTGRRHLYCTKLAYSEWYLVTVMPYGVLDEAVVNLGSQWIYMVFTGCAVILLALLLVFAKYAKITRQQIEELEIARRTAENATRAKSEFLSNMSHDIRTPMNAIVGMTAIAVANINNVQQVQNCLKKISLSSKHLLGLINDVLDMSKIESGKMTLNFDQISLREVMENIVSIIQPQIKAKKQKLNVSIHDILTENVYCNSVRLNQVLLNLLSNSIKFTPEEGTIQLAVYEEKSDVGEDYVRIHLQVKDTGIGMSPEFKEKIFESFTREDNKRVHQIEGSGLGMAITKYIVDAMGGVIEVESELGKGSEFNITLDLEKAMVQEADMVLPDWNMLVVDDDKQLCESTVASLKSIGVKAEWTLDGETAVEMVERRHRRGEDYHIILLDWKLPGMDGIETAREIRKRLGGEIPILLISAYDWSDIEDGAREAGVNGFISKPLFKSTLFYGLRQFANSPDQPQESREEVKVDFHGKRVLLAEDNELNWEIANELLSNLGLELEWAENGQICVEKFQKSPEGFYDAILMDVRMPVMDGLEATRTIRGLNRADAAEIPILAMTANAFSEDIQECLACGMNTHLAKPIDMREVSRQLEKYLK